MKPATVRLGLAANGGQFAILVVVNAFVGAMVGLERSTLPLLAADGFGIESTSVVLSFLVAFGITKAGANLVAGYLSDRGGRKPLLVAGWLIALPVCPMILLAPSWGWVVAANVLLGVNQGLTWSVTVIMKIDLAGPRRRGLAMGLNEVSGYAAVALAAWVTARLAAAYGPRPAPYLLGIGISLAGLALSVFAVRETAGHAALEGRAAGPQAVLPARGTFADVSWRNPTLSSACLAGLVNNLNDAMAWGLLPIWLASRGLPLSRIGVVAALYPASWGLGQLVTGAWSDRVGRKPLIVAGLWVQAAGIAWFALGRGYGHWASAALVMGWGTALVYPTLIASVADASHPSKRGVAVGIYRMWRDLGYAAGALLSGLVADALGVPAAIWTVAVITAAAGAVVTVRMRETLPSEREGGDMRAIDCPCGHRLEGADDDALVVLAGRHIAEHHPEMQRSDEQLRERVTNDAYDVVGS